MMILLSNKAIQMYLKVIDILEILEVKNPFF